MVKKYNITKTSHFWKKQISKISKIGEKLIIAQKYIKNAEKSVLSRNVTHAHANISMY